MYVAIRPVCVLLCENDSFFCHFRHHTINTATTIVLFPPIIELFSSSRVRCDLQHLSVSNKGGGGVYPTAPVVRRLVRGTGGRKANKPKRHTKSPKT